MLPLVLGVDLVISDQHSMINPQKRQRRETFPPSNILQKLILHIAQAYLIKLKKKNNAANPCRVAERKGRVGPQLVRENF